MIPTEIRQSIQNIIDYNWDDEAQDFEDFGGDDNHIFVHLKAVQTWLDEEETFEKDNAE